MAFLPDARDSGFFFFTIDHRCYRFCRWTLYNKSPAEYIISVSKKIKNRFRKIFPHGPLLITANTAGKYTSKSSFTKCKTLAL